MKKINNAPITNWFFYSLYLFIVIRISWLSYTDPIYNWDMLPYMAIVLNFEQADLAQVHREVYHVARTEIPSPSSQYMVDTTHVIRRAVMADHDKFFQYVSFFKTKPLYSFMSFIFYTGGMSLSHAVIFPSAIFFFLISILLLLWIKKYCTAWLAVILSASIIVSPPLIEASRLATPDVMSAFVIVTAFYLMYCDYKWYWIVLVLTVSLLIRVDNVLLSSLMLFFLAFQGNTGFSQNRSRILAVALILIAWSLIVFFIMGRANYQDGMNNFYGGLYKKLNPVTLMHDAVGGLTTLQFSSMSILISLSFLALFVSSNYRVKPLNLDQGVFLVVVLHVLIKYTIFPDLNDRHYLSNYIVLIIIIFRFFISREYLHGHLFKGLQKG